jgi:hypothetical protein
MVFRLTILPSLVRAGKRRTRVETKRGTIHRVKYWELIADNLSKADWSWGCVSTVDSRGRIIFVADAHRSDGQCFIVRADEKLTAFVELESAIRGGIFSEGKNAADLIRLGRAACRIFLRSNQPR